MYNKFVVVDLETTGNSPKKGDRIIQFAAVVIVNGEIVDKFSSLVNPKTNIPIFIEELTGINNEMVIHAPYFEELAPKIQFLLEDAYFVAHNVLFDLSFLQEELLMAKQDGFFGSVIDTVEMARFLYPTIDSYKLNDLANQLGFQHDRPHQADSDAEVTAEILMHFLKIMETIPLSTCVQLSELSSGLKSDIHLLFEDVIEMKSRKMEKWPQNLEIVNGLTLRKHSQLPVTLQKDEKEYSFPESNANKEILLKQAFSSYQARNGQFQMMDEVYDAFINSSHLVLEAGTGIGKSMGYLMPAAYFSRITGNKVMISTFTTQLQSQLILNDIPLLKQTLPFDINIALLKGKTHYINLSKFEESLHETEDNYDSCLTKMQILIWLLETETGDVDELNLSSGGQIFWNRIKHGQKSMPKNELWLEKDFFIRAKNRINTADLIITNHALLLSDMTSPVFPDVEYVILDEGHHFHKVAMKYFGGQLDYFRIRLLLNQFGLLEQKQMLYKLETYAKGINKSHHFNSLNKLIADLFFEMDEFFKTIRIYVKNNSKIEPTFRVNQRIDREEHRFNMLFHSAERFSFLIKEFIDLIQSISIHLEVTKRVNAQRLLDEIKQGCEELTKIREQISRIFLNSANGDVAWIEIDFRSYQNSTTVYLQPLSVATQIQELFLANKKSVIITSATLTIDQQFHYILNEFGLSKLTKTLNIPSPFNYQKQVKVFIPKDLPEINMVTIEDYVASISEQIISIAEVTKGRILLLFTSHDMLRKTYVLMKESGLLEDYALIAQGITSGSRNRLTRNFQKFDKAILFGTSSFWEGIDIPGEDLSCVIMVRLPFSPPDEPFIQAKSEEVKRLGGNPFMEVSLPEAVLRFKQGFGRLIRTKDDKGVLIIFDRRIITTKYGKAFFSSIPDVPIKNINLDDILHNIRSWLP
jgi:ATP-dependent DNA helicase DinG